MDSNANTGPVSPDPKPHHHDIAEAGPIDPSTGQPDRHAEVSAIKSWFRQNAMSLVLTGLAVGLVCVYLDPIDTLKVVLGLGFIIFIHELGHFLAAKWCDVHVRTFSIGFGPAVPFCSYKWGETTYMLGVIPLGGYVAMVGEGTGDTSGDAEPEEEEDDPRSFKRKTVGQRMLIISAGVIMNILFGMGCFVAAYLHGVQEKPASVGWVESGSAAWRGGIRTDADIKRIGSRENPFFNDIRPIVMSSLQGEQVPVSVEYRGQREEFTVEPLRDEGVPFPQLGIAPPYRLTLLTVRRPGARPVIPGSKAAAAEPRFEPGDRIIGMSDPEKYPEVTALPLDREGRPDFNAYHKRMVLLASKPITFQILRRDQPDGASPTRIEVRPTYRTDLGTRMQMGKVAALRRGGPAEGKMEPVPVAGPPSGPGDRIKAVKLPPGRDGRATWFVNGSVDWTKPEFKTADATQIDVRPLDPILLPLELQKWADANPPTWAVQVIVLRQHGHKEDEPTELTLQYDPSFRFDRETVNLPNSPLPLPGLGLAYWVEAVVGELVPGGPAATAGLQPNDKVEAVQFRSIDQSGETKVGEWDELKSHQWAYVDAALQTRPPGELGLRVRRGDEVKEITLTTREDTAWAASERGLVFQQDVRTQKAGDMGEALNLGARRTVRFIREIYMNLYAMVFGRISAKTISGPLTIATVSYKIAGEDFWQFLLFLGMISVNLAVVNFLPIPVLDGGHMVFLLLEKILGRPVPEKLFAFAMYTGLFLILALFVFVITMDIRRVVFGWF